MDVPGLTSPDIGRQVYPAKQWHRLSCHYFDENACAIVQQIYLSWLVFGKEEWLQAIDIMVPGAEFNRRHTDFQTWNIHLSVINK